MATGKRNVDRRRGYEIFGPRALCYDKLFKVFQNPTMRDIDIRNKLKTTRLKKFYQDDDSRVIEELSLCAGDARVDVAVINGSLHGYEIKSESDTLIRLPNQIETYSKVFDYITVCAGPRHLETVLITIPEWCGVILASQNKKNGLTLKTMRAPKRNENIDNLSLAQLLWRSEALEGLNRFGITKGIASKPKPYLWSLLAQSVPTTQLADYVRAVLKARENWRSESQPFGSGDYLPLFAK